MLPNYGKSTLTRFFIRTFEAFFARQQPVSNIANPACMNMTSTPQRTSQAKSMAPAMLSWVSVICFSSFHCSSNNAFWACNSRRSSAGVSCDIAVTVKAAAREAARQTFILMTVDGQLPLRFSNCSALRKSGCKKRARRWREAIANYHSCTSRGNQTSRCTSCKTKGKCREDRCNKRTNKQTARPFSKQLQHTILHRTQVTI